MSEEILLLSNDLLEIRKKYINALINIEISKREIEGMLKKFDEQDKIWNGYGSFVKLKHCENCNLLGAIQWTLKFVPKITKRGSDKHLCARCREKQ